MKMIFTYTLCFLCSLFLWADIKYVEIKSIGNVPTMELKRIEDVQLIVRDFDLKIGYIQNVQNNPTASWLILIADGTYFIFSTKGFKTIDDYIAGSNGGFRDGVDYYEAVELNLTKTSKPDSSLYYFYKRNKFKSVDDCKDAFNKGFAFDENIWTEKDKQELVVTGKESSVYYKAKDAQLANYAEYQEFMPGLERGFKTKADIQDANKKGFDKVRGDEYYSAMASGFSNYTDYKAARDIGLENQSSYDNYKKIVAEVDSIMNHQQLNKANAFIYFYLCQVPKGQQSLEVLVTTLKNIQQQQDAKLTQALDLYYSDITSLAEWENNYTRNYGYSSSSYRLNQVSTLISQSNLSNFFKSVDTSKIGTYSETTGIFTRNGNHFIQLGMGSLAKTPVQIDGEQQNGLLVILEKIVGGNTSHQAVIPVSQEYGSKREVLDWYTSLGQVGTKTSDVIPASVIVEVVLGYKQADKAASTEITQRQSEIKDYLRRYFTELTVEDLRPRNEEKRRIEIKNAINQKILKNSEIRDVRFLSLQIIEQ